MIITRTPLRISFVGGATDIANYYEKYGGEVVSCAINRYIYVTYNRRDDKKIVVCYSKTEVVDSVDEIQHEIVREALKMAHITDSAEIHIIGNISTIGTGLGGSSAVAVGVLKALFLNETKQDLARMACILEIERLNKFIGKQDQYACAIGGVNSIEFVKNGDVHFLPVECFYNLDGYMFIVPIKNIKRSNAEDILKKQDKEDNLPILHNINNLCAPFQEALNFGYMSKIVTCLNKYWDLKKQLSDQVTTPEIDKLIEKYRAQGCGVKLCGAGQSGFLFVFDPSGKCDGIPVNIDYNGTTSIIF